MYQEMFMTSARLFFDMLPVSSHVFTFLLYF